MGMAFGIDVGPNVPTSVLVLHVVLSLLFFWLGLSNFVNGRPIGLVLNGLIGVLVIGVGVAAARIIGRR